MSLESEKNKDWIPEMEGYATCQDKLGDLRSLVEILSTLLGTIEGLGRNLSSDCGSFCLSFEDPWAGGDECGGCDPVPFEVTDTGFV